MNGEDYTAYSGIRKAPKATQNFETAANPPYEIGERSVPNSEVRDAYEIGSAQRRQTKIIQPPPTDQLARSNDPLEGRTWAKTTYLPSDARKPPRRRAMDELQLEGSIDLETENQKMYFRHEVTQPEKNRLSDELYMEGNHDLKTENSQQFLPLSPARQPRRRATDELYLEGNHDLRTENNQQYLPISPLKQTRRRAMDELHLEGEPRPQNRK